jgi:hypothetical protein
LLSLVNMNFLRAHEGSNSKRKERSASDHLDKT